MLFYLDRFIEIFFLPPGINILTILIGFLLFRFKPMLTKLIIGLSILSLWLFSMPFIAQSLINPLQNQYTALSPKKLSPEKDSAIVILEAGLNLVNPEYNEAIVSEGTLVRIRYAAYLHQLTKAPILVSGYDPSHSSINQTDYMAKALSDFFGIKAKWREPNGYNTAQEGIFTAKILSQTTVKKLYLVTHAFHMPRAVYSFRNRGFEIIPAPTGYKSFDYPLGKISAILPSMPALAASNMALREYLGLFWYRFHYHF